MAMTPEPADLPPGLTCNDCAHFAGRCSWLVSSLTGAETRCDWSPSRFRPKPVSGGAPAGDAEPDTLIADLEGWATVLGDGRDPHPAELADACQAMREAAEEIRRLRADLARVTSANPLDRIKEPDIDWDMDEQA